MNFPFSAYPVHQSGLMLWFCLEWPWAGNHLGAGIGNVFVLLGRCILLGKPGVQDEASSPLSVFHRAEGKKLVCYISTQPTQGSNNENLLNRQIWQGYRAALPLNFTLIFATCVWYFDRAYYGPYVTSRIINCWGQQNLTTVELRGVHRVFLYMVYLICSTEGLHVVLLRVGIM